jgi:threonine dehydrogenase-like Zn-dependent dehydrogenase
MFAADRDRPHGHHQFPLDDVVEAFRVASDRAAGAIKVVLHP